MYHYFTGLDFRWCGSTSCESSRTVKYLRRIDTVWVYWTWMTTDGQWQLELQNMLVGEAGSEQNDF